MTNNVRHFAPKTLHKKAEFLVLIPAYNCEKFISTAIGSVLKQKNVAIRLVVSENCSKDQSLEQIIAAVERNTVHDVEVIRQPKTLNMVDHWNYLIDYASGCHEEAFSILHADDVLLGEDTLAVGLNGLRQHPEVNLVFSGVAYINGSGRVIGRRAMRSDTLFDMKRIARASVIRASNRFGIPIAMRSTAMKRFAVDYKYAMDIDYILRVNEGKLLSIYKSYCHVGYRTHLGSATYSVQKGAFQDFVKLNREFDIGLNWLELSASRFLSFANPMLRRLWIAAATSFKQSASDQG